MFNEPLVGPDFGSYPADDVKWLLKDISYMEIESNVEDREEAIQSGQAHYSESLPVEYQPTAEYQELFVEAMNDNLDRVAQAVAKVTKLVVKERGNTVVLASLARAGTPIGVLMRRYAKENMGLDLPHYAISVIRDRGLDKNAIKYLLEHHRAEDIVFVDGWTGKGAITKEIEATVAGLNAELGVSLNPAIAVLADPAQCVRYSGTREDFLIPSACMNSTISGLVSRTVLNDNLIGESDYHGAKFYREFADNDYSNVFVDAVAEVFRTIDHTTVEEGEVDDNPSWVGWKTIQRVSREFGIKNINLIKPGVGETTRVLLRRVPWKVLMKRSELNSLTHIRVLCEQRGAELVVVEELPYSCIGIIYPKYD
ncbi:MAG: cysteine protease StiP family protein [Enterococcus sp.]|nr:cysteine protease StiP family protein [Enterococcus sp.]